MGLSGDESGTVPEACSVRGWVPFRLHETHPKKPLQIPRRGTEYW